MSVAERLHARGSTQARYAEVTGVEPGAAAIEAASPRVRPRIVHDTFAQACSGRTPSRSLRSSRVSTTSPIQRRQWLRLRVCWLLAVFLLCLNHDVRALSARALGEHSPIFDVEHTYLWSEETLGLLMRKHGLAPVAGGSVVNHYSLGYVSQLLPLRAGQRAACCGRSTGPGSGGSRSSYRLAISGSPGANRWLMALLSAATTATCLSERSLETMQVGSRQRAAATQRFAPGDPEIAKR